MNTTFDIPTITVIIGGIVTVIGVLGPAVVTIIAALRRVEGITTTVAVSAAKIEGHVNSEKTAADGRELALRREIELLRELLATQKQTAALLAQATASPAARRRTRDSGSPIGG